MAHHLKNRSKYIYYEILNEPHGIDDAAWGAIQQTVIETIRKEDVTHFIIVGGVNWNNYKNLKNIPEYKDQKLIYTFHFYDPFIFTHQGATWVSPSMATLSNVPFPYKADKIPAVAAPLQGTWLEKAIGGYSHEGTPQKVKELIDIAIEFSLSRKVPIFCGEFGVYIPNSDNKDRIEWYKLVVDYLNEKKIPWTMWDYKGTFGLFNKGSQESFDHDLNLPLVEAMKLNTPK
jgi:endoglucanase